MSKQVKLHIGTARDMGRRFVDAWRRSEVGAAVDETHLTFYDLEALLKHAHHEAIGAPTLRSSTRCVIGSGAIDKS